MKFNNRWWLVLLMAGLLCLPAGSLFAQRGGKRPAKARKTSFSFRHSARQKKPRVARQTPVMEVTSGQIQEFGVSVPVAEIKRQVDEIQLQREPLRSALHATFRTYPRSHLFRRVFSGSLFRTEYQGREELYGAIATHALAPLPSDILTHVYANASLHREFPLEVYTKDGEWVTLSAEVIQLGAFGLGDVSLIKIKDNFDRSKLHFFSLKKEPIREDETLSSLGFIPNQLIYIPQRNVLEKSLISVRTTMPGAPGGFRGTCGGAGFDQAGELALIHTGSKPTCLAQTPRVGYGTYVWFLNKLVEAYHNNGEAYIPFELNGQHVADLRVDEYVSSFSLWNETGERIFQVKVKERFSFQAAEKWIQSLAPRSIELVIGRVTWAPEKNEFIVLYPEVRRIYYDFGTELPVTPNE